MLPLADTKVIWFEDSVARNSLFGLKTWRPELIFMENHKIACPIPQKNWKLTYKMTHSRVENSKHGINGVSGQWRSLPWYFKSNFVHIIQFSPFFSNLFTIGSSLLFLSLECIFSKMLINPGV